MPRSTTLYTRIRQILESARIRVARSVNTTQVVANWLIGREIVEEEQHGAKRAGCGDRLIRDLAKRLGREFGGGYGLSQLKDFRAFFLTYDQLLEDPKSHAVRGLLPADPKSSALRSESGEWKSGQLSPNLSWTHYRTLMRVDRPDARAFYEIEAVKESWSPCGSNRKGDRNPLPRSLLDPTPRPEARPPA